MRIAVPCEGDQVSMHFGHAQEFAMFEADEKSGTISGEQRMTPPPHEPGILPKWLAENNVNVVLTGGMGGRARDLCAQNGVHVVPGITGGTVRDAVENHLKGKLDTDDKPCDHCH